MLKKIKPYVLSAAVALAVGGLAALLTRGNMRIYAELAVPPLAPPAVLFPIVWTVLYVLMGAGYAMVKAEKTEKPVEVKSASRVYWIQLAVNFLWSIIFFNLREFLFAFIWLVLLWILILLMIARFAAVSKTAAYLQFPYLLWVAFAGYLNLMIYVMN